MVKDYINIEKKIHLKFQKQKKIGEWFKLNNDDLKLIKKILKENEV